MDLVYPNERRLFRIALVLSIIVWAVIILGTVGIALLYIGLFFLFAIFAHSAFITHVRGNGVKITAEQYPDLHQRLLECCEKVGQKEVPEMYLLRTDFFNALATRFLRRHYIVLFTDVVDALIAKPGAVNFYIGHELGHIHRNHIRWGWVLAPVMWLPVLGSALRRAEEYTCDRYGNACCESEEDAVAAMTTIVAGDTRWRDIDVEAYLDQVKDTSGFFMSFNEFIGEYPWLCKRLAWVQALRAGSTPDLPRRNVLAGILSVFVPSVPGGAVSFIILIAIIGILAAIAIPAYQGYIEAAQQAEELATQAPATESAPSYTPSSAATAYLSPYATPEDLTIVMNELAVIREQISAHYAANQTFPGDLTEMGGESSFVMTSHGSLPMAVYEGGVIGVTLGTDAGGVEAYFVNEPAVNENGGVDWYCYGQDVDSSAMPEMCR